MSEQTPEAPTELRRCTYIRKGPKIRGGRILAWTQQCKRMVIVPAGTPVPRCHQHPRRSR